MVFVWRFNNWTPEKKYCSLIKVLKPSIYLIFYITNIIAALSVTIFLHVKIFQIAKKQISKIHVADHDRNIQNNTQGLDNKVNKMMTLVLGAFLICWTPYSIINIIVGFVNKLPTWLDIMYKLSLTLLYSNSFMNPIIYGWRNRCFREAFKKLLSLTNNKLCQKKNINQTMTVRYIGNISIQR